VADAPPAAPADADAPAAVLAELTQAVRRFGAEQRRVPQGLEELVQHGYLGRMPPAPAGRRFAITRDLRVVLE
jgi:plasmid stabilization system protein ParE